jgi:phosphoadenosine phosphosulfate reductase
MTANPALFERVSPDFAAKLAHTRDLLRQAAREHPGAIRQASSLGAEDMVISHLINRMDLPIGIFVLDTGKLHPETLALLERLRAGSKAPVEVLRPVAEQVVHFVRREGEDAMYKSIEQRLACCQVRKLEPLARALAGQTAWITGLRREQSGARASAPAIDNSNAARVKFNPLADWTWGDVWHYILTFAVDYNPLHDQFYPSIGCMPCTRAITPGQDFRAGRWWWESEVLKECGLHVKPPSAPDDAATEGFASAQAHIAAGDMKPEVRSEAKTAREGALA